MLKGFYENYILKSPKFFLYAIAVFAVVIGFFITKLEIDASAQTLLLEGDKDLEFTRDTNEKFKTSDFLIVTYTTKDQLLSKKNIENIKLLSKQLLEVDFVDSVTNITNVPLLQSPVRSLDEVMKDMYTLESKGVDKTLAKQELLTNPIYKQNLVSEDFKTTALLVNLKFDSKYYELINENNKFIKLKQNNKLSKENQNHYELLTKKLKLYRDEIREKNHQNILEVRKVLREFEKQNDIKLHLGGTTMIADDMVEFVKYDLKTFGFGILVLLFIVIYALFKEFRWVVLPLFIAFVSIVITSGFLGLFGWEITVISSNFISLQLIMNISLVIHLIIKYKELHILYPKDSQEQLVKKSVLAMAKPSFFVVITTIAGFSSLVFSNILPVINFGWMMSLGIVISLICTFLLFPVILILFAKSTKNILKDQNKPFSSILGDIALKHPKSIIFFSFLIVLFSISGALKLKVENSFIDYFKESTEIYKGMKVIDQSLGGTTPLDVVITFKDNSNSVQDIQVKEQEQEISSEFGEFLDEFEQTSADDKENYWFTNEKLNVIKKVHNYLETLPEIGKVLSLKTMLDVGKSLNNGEEFDTFSLSLMYKELPLEYKNIILSPYVNVEENIVKISARIIDSKENINRNQLIKDINKNLNEIVDPKYQQFRLSNLLVMYNNMLQSLFDSQIKTIGVVVVILFLMFLVLFQSLKIASVAIVANLIPVSVIFGVMGWFDIPLDMMTITIAAISIGIAVDDTIHYIHRFKTEYNQGSDYKEALVKSHSSIGVAMFYTSTVIVIGFSILVFSNFIPTIYFGLLTVLAMSMAIAADLLLLPVLLKILYKKPFK